MDVADACRERGLQTVAVTAGYMHPEPRRDFYAKMDAANVDLKAFTEDFYKRITFSRLEPILDTLKYLVQQTNVWTEITTLLIPGHNDSEQEVARLSEWVADHLGLDVPIHFTAFHPDFKMLDVPRTPRETLRRSRAIALSVGLRHVYTGNVHDPEGDATSCAGCGAVLIRRDWYEILEYRLTAKGTCPECDRRLVGRFAEKAERFGRRRIPVRVAAR
jgi:pyruvate formate lyase activating enzyme